MYTCREKASYTCITVSAALGNLLQLRLFALSDTTYSYTQYGTLRGHEEVQDQAPLKRVHREISLIMG